MGDNVKGENKNRKDFEISGIDWKRIKTVKDLDTVPQEEIYDESLGTEDFELALMPNLTAEEVEDALFWKDYVRGIILITGGEGQGKGMLAHMMAYKFKRYFRYVRVNKPDIWCPLKVISDTRPRKLFGRVIPFSEAFLVEQMSRMNEHATNRFENVNMDIDDMLSDVENPHTAEDGRWISSRGEVLIQRAVWLLDEFGGKYMNRREPNDPIHRALLFKIFPIWRHLDSVIIAMAQELDDLDPRCFPRITTEIETHRAPVYNRKNNEIIRDALVFNVNLRPRRYISALGELEFIGTGSTVSFRLDGKAPRDCLGGKAWKDLYVSKQSIGVKAPNSMRRKYQ